MKLFSNMRTKRVLRVQVLVAVTLALSLFTLPLIGAGTTTTTSLKMLTLGPDGIGGDNESVHPVVSADGSMIVFTSHATNLIDGFTTSGGNNIYLYEVATGEITLVTTGHDGTGSDGDSYYDLAAISADGSTVVFQIKATNIIDGITTTDTWNVYLYDVATKETTLITAGPDGKGITSTYPWGIDISGDGSRVVFPVYSNDELFEGVTMDGYRQLVTYDVASQELSLLTAGPDGNGGNGESRTPAISYDGSRIAFGTNATDLIDGKPLSGSSNVLLWDETEGFMLLTPGLDGTGSDAFDSRSVSLSADGTRATFSVHTTDEIPGLTLNGNDNIILWDETDGYTLVTAGPLGEGGNGRSTGSFISADGTKIGLMSQATDLIGDMTTNGNQQVYLYDVATAQLELISKGASASGGDANSYRPTLIRDGSMMAFHSAATDLIEDLSANGERQVFLWERVTTHEVTFDAANGSASTMEVVRDGARLAEPSAPTLEGYSFDGWWTSPTGGSRWNFATDVVTSDLTLTARWTKITTGGPDGNGNGGGGNGGNGTGNGNGNGNVPPQSRPSTLPETGDNTSAATWAAVLAVASLVVAGTVAYRQSNKNKQVGIH